MRKLRLWKQHTTETCGIACMLMIQDYFGDEKDFPTKSKEALLYQMYGTKEKFGPLKDMPGTLGAAIAYALSRRGLDVSLVHSEENYMKNDGGYYSEEIYAALLEKYKDYIAKDGGIFEVRTSQTIDCAMLREELGKDRLVILQTLIEGNADGVHDHVLHAMLLYKCDKDKIYAINPYGDERKYRWLELSDEEVESYMETPVGRMYISVGERSKASADAGAQAPTFKESCSGGDIDEKHP